MAYASIKTEGLDEEGRQRIYREAQAMGELDDHPNIVTVYEIGEEAGQPYIVTQFMAGGDVEALIEKAPDHKLTLERSLDIAVAVCRGLEHAHSKRFIHRDIKPGNVWLTLDGIPKIGDFGLAVAMDKIRLTKAGMIVGTVSYMPPEQATGGEPVFRSDLYSLGAMLYEMVCGRPPFIGDDSIGIISQHINIPPVSPSWHRPDLPPALETLILRLLEKDHNKRPATASEVLRALESIDLTPSPQPSPARGEGDKGGPTVADNPVYRRAFVGREAEFRQLKTAFDNALSGVGSMAMVVGEPGIGKTAFCEHLAAYVSLRGGLTLVGHCYEEGSLSLPYLAFIEAMRSYVLDHPSESLRDELGAGASDVARIVSEIRARVQVEPRPSGDPEDDRWRLLQAVTTFLRNASIAQPILLVIEDLHWADRGTLDLLTHLARNMSGARLMVIGTYRDVEVDRAHPLSSTLAELRRVGELHRVLLRGLTIDEVHRMIKIIGGQEVSLAFAEAVYRQTEGNPLFIQEFLRYVVEEGLVARQGGRWHGTGDTPLEMSIPEGLRDVIGKRLSRLSPECNRLLSIAAVIGRDFSLETLRQVSGLEEEPLVQALEEALRVGVLEERSRPGSIQYHFAHAFFRQTLYEEMIAPRRLRLHQEVARALEAQYAGRLEEHAAELTEHFAQSTDPNDLSKAVEYGELAAQRAMAVNAFSEAARLLETAVQIQDVVDTDNKSKRCDLLLALGQALMLAGEPLRAAEEGAEVALSLAETLGDQERASRACVVALFSHYRYSGALVTAGLRKWAERADRYAPPDTATRAEANIALSWLRLQSNQFEEVRSLRTQALELARHLDAPETLFRAVMSLTNGQFVALQHKEEQFRLAEEFFSRPTAGVSGRTLGLLFRTIGIIFIQRGDRERGEECWRRLREVAERTRDPEAIGYVHVADMLRATLDGHLEDALEIVADILAQEGTAISTRNLLGTWIPRFLFHLGRGEEALIALRMQVPGVEEPGNRAVMRVLCLAHLGRREEASALLHDLISRYGITATEDETPSSLLVQLLETAVLVEDQEISALLAGRLSDIATLAVGGEPVLTCPGRHLGAAAALLGEPEKAKAYYQQALEVCAKVRYRPETAIIHLQLAELLLEEAEEMRRSQGRGDLAPTDVALDVGVGSPDPTASVPTAEDIHREAIEHLDLAIAEFQEMKMQPFLERALRHKGILKA